MAEAKRDNNHIPSLLAVSNSDSTTPVVVEADPTTKRLLVNSTLTGTINATVSSADGAIVDGVASTIKASVKNYSNGNPLLVRLTDTSGDYVSAGAGTQYTENDSDTTPTGTVAMGSTSGSIHAIKVDSDGTQVARISVGTISIQDGGNSITVDGTVTANLAAGTNNIGDVDILSIAAGDNNIGNVDIASIAAGDNNIGNVDVVTLPALAAGSNTIGTVSVNDGGGSITVDGTVTINAIPAGNNNIGDVDVASVPAPLSTTGGGTEATALRVTVASDSTGVLSVDDNSGSLTVDGSLTTVSTVTDLTNGTVNLSRGAPDVTSVIYDGATAVTPSFGTITFSTLGNNVVLGTISAKRIRVIAMNFTNGTATNIYITDSAGATLWGNSTNTGQFAANSGVVLPYNPVGWFQTGSGNALIFNLSTTSSVAGSFNYLQI